MKIPEQTEPYDLEPSCRNDLLRFLRRPFGRAYLATTESDHKVGGVVVIHHFPGYDEATKEIVRKFAANGYNAVCVNLYYRESPDASFDDAAAAARASGGVPTINWSVTSAAAAKYLRRAGDSNQKVGVIATALGGDSQCSRRAV